MSDFVLICWIELTWDADVNLFLFTTFSPSKNVQFPVGSKTPQSGDLDLDQASKQECTQWYTQESNQPNREFTKEDCRWVARKPEKSKNYKERAKIRVSKKTIKRRCRTDQAQPCIVGMRVIAAKKMTRTPSLKWNEKLRRSRFFRSANLLKSQQRDF